MNFTQEVFLVLCTAHNRLENIGFKGERPKMNFHPHVSLPTCVYQHRTNAIALCAPTLSKLHYKEIDEKVKDAMAMCGCYRSYKQEMLAWDACQNKGRMKHPALGMHGGPLWRSIRSQL